MEATQQSHQPSEDTNNVGSGARSKGSFHCRKGSSRWKPTTDHIRILKGHYYNNGIKSLEVKEIQKLTARLKVYGKIEDKNVRYWFQNQKAREKKKKRNTPDHQLIAPARGPTNLHQQQPATRSNNWYIPISCIATSHDTTSPISCIATSHAWLRAGTWSPAGLVGVGQIGSYRYGPKTMEKSFRECSISSQASSTIGGLRSQNYGWIASNIPNNDPFIPFYDFYKYRMPRVSGGHLNDPEVEEYEEDEEEGELSCQVQTLPLFPMHDEDLSSNIKGPSSNSNHSSYYFGNNVGDSYTSLELSLNSLVGHSHDAL